MSNATPSSIDLAALIVSLGVLIVASLSDLKTREVSNRFWIIYAPVAGALFLARIVFVPDAAAILLVSAGATIVVAFLLFQFGAMGGADSKAFGSSNLLQNQFQCAAVQHVSVSCRTGGRR